MVSGMSCLKEEVVIRLFLSMHINENLKFTLLGISSGERTQKMNQLHIAGPGKSNITTSSFMHDNPLTIQVSISGDDGVLSVSAAESEAMDRKLSLICQIVGN